MNENNKKPTVLKKEEVLLVAPIKEVAETAKIVKIGLNLEKTLTVVEELYRKSKQLTRLKFYAERLRGFEIEQKDEDFKNESHYNGCALTISDDKRDKFELKNPFLIKEVAEFLAKRFEDKTAEIEAEIVLP